MKNDKNNHQKQYLEASKEFMLRQKIIAETIANLDTTEYRRNTLDAMGCFIAGLSEIKLIYILSLMGLATKRDYEYYQKFEKQYIENVTRGIVQNIKVFDMAGDGRAFKVGVSLNNIPVYFEQVKQLANQKGYQFSFSDEEIKLARSFEATAELFESLKTNCLSEKINFEDGVIHSSWVENNDFEKTECAIIKNIILAKNSLEIEDEKLDAYLNAVCLARFKREIDKLFQEAMKYPDVAEKKFLMHWASVMLEIMMKIKEYKIDINEELLLYKTLEQFQANISKIKDKDLRESVERWLEAGTKSWKHKLTKKEKETEIFVDERLTEIFINNGEVEEESVEMPKTKEVFFDFNQEFYVPRDEKNKTADKKLTREELLNALSKKYHHVVFDELSRRVNRQSNEVKTEWKQDMDQMLPQYRNLYVLNKFSEPYVYYMLGIITLNDADELAYEGKKLLRAKQIEKIHSVLMKILNQEGEFPEEIDEINQEFQAFLAGDHKDFDLLECLEKLDVHGEELDELNPSTGDILAYLYTQNEEKYTPLALRFKKEYLALVPEFKEIAELLLENYQKAKFLDLEDVLPMEQCVDEESKSITIINKLTLINDVFRAIDEKDDTIISDEAKNVFKQAAIGCYHNILKQLDECSANKYNIEIKPQIHRMVSIFSSLFEQNNTFKDIDKYVAYLGLVCRQGLERYTQSEADVKHYLEWFDMKFGSTREEDEQCCNTKLHKKGAKAPNQELITEEEKQLIIDDLKRFYYGHSELKSQKNRTERGIFGMINDAELLYCMGVLTKLEFQNALYATDEILEQREYETDVSIQEIAAKLVNQVPRLELPITRLSLKVKNQIRRAGQLYDLAYNNSVLINPEMVCYEEIQNISAENLEKDPLKWEGIMLENIILIAKNLKDEAILEATPFKKIIESYWRESVQQLKLLEQTSKKDIALRVASQKNIFGKNTFKEAEKRSLRLKYYPRLFQQVREGIMRNYENNFKIRHLVRRKFEDVIAPFENLVLRMYQKDLFINFANNPKGRNRVK